MGRSGALAVGRASEETRDTQQERDNQGERAKQMRRAKTKRREKRRRNEGDDMGKDWVVRQMGDVKSPRI